MDNNEGTDFLFLLAVLLLTGVGGLLCLWHNGGGFDDQLALVNESGKSKKTINGSPFALLDHDRFVNQTQARDLTTLSPGSDPMKAIWGETSADEMRLLEALGRSDIPVSKEVRSFLKLAQRGADEKSLVGFIDEHFRTIEQLPYRAATLEWLHGRYPELSPAHGSVQQGSVEPHKLVDDIQRVGRDQ